MADGWIKLYRNIQDHWLWQEEKNYTRLQAWFDLLLLANHKVGKVLIGNELVTVEVGCHLTSQQKLMDRWGWGNTKVRNFLKLLKDDGMIEYSGEKYTLIKIINYEIYQKQTESNTVLSMDDEGQQTTNKLPTNCEQTDNKLQANTNKNDKNEKNNILSAKQTPYSQIKDLFNAICTTLPKIKGIEGNRQKVVQSRWKEHSDLKVFEDIFKRVDKSEFLSGRNDKWKGCCFDWIMKPSNIQKILEGNYDNKEPPKHSPTNDFDFTGL